MKQKNYFNDARRSRWLPTLVMLLAMFAGGVSPAWGETLTETFDGVTVTSRYLLSNGWIMVHNNGNYQGFGGSYDYQIKSGNYNGETGNSLYCSYSDNNEYVVIPTKICGNFTYYAKRAESSNGTIDFYEATKNGDDFTVTSTQLGTTSTSNSWSQKTLSLGDEGKYVAIRLIKSRIDQISVTIYEEISGPALEVKDGSTKLTTGYDYNFGLTTAGTTKTFTLSNPGTAAVEGLAVTDKFGATLSATTIAAGGEVTLTITMPDASASEAITISSTTTGIDDFVINVSGTVRDANKIYLDFADGQIPDGWTSVMIGSYGSAWAASTGYISQSGSYSSYAWAFTSPLLKFTADETLCFDISKYGNSSYYTPSLTLQESVDGTNWTDVKVVETSDIVYGSWKTITVTMTAGVKYIRFNGWYSNITRIYGGELAPPTPIVSLSENTYDFGLVAADKVSSTFTLTNNGTGALSNLQVLSSNTDQFTVAITDDANSIAINGTATFTVTMKKNGTGYKEGTITIKGDDIEDIELAVSGTVKDDSKMFVGFDGIADGDVTNENIPAGWTFTANGAGWKYYNEGIYYWNSSTNSSSPTNDLVSPLVTISGATESIFFDAYKNTGSGYSSYASLTVSVSKDKNTWTQVKSVASSDMTGSFKTFSFNGVEAGNYYIKFTANNVCLDNIYGGTLSTAPVIKFTDTAYNFGLITEQTTSSTFTITNDGQSVLNNLKVESSDESVFTTTVTGNATSIAAGESVTFTVTMKAVEGAHNGTITISGDDADNATMTVSGAMLKAGAATVDFNDNAMPARWTNTSSYSSTWTFTDGAAYASGNRMMVSPKMQFADGDFLVVKAKQEYSGDSYYVKIESSADASEWSEVKTINTTNDGLNTSNYKSVIVSGIPTTAKYLRVTAYYTYIDEITGLTYAPELAVKQADETIATDVTYPFGEIGANQTVTYNFTNAGAGTINITNVVSGNEVFTTNWTESTAVPFDLTITANYDAAKAGEQNGAITVTTTEGEFVINLTSTFQAANTPKMDMYLGDATQEGYTDEKSATGANLGFGIITANATKKFTIYNSGTGALNITGIALPDADYSTDLEAAPTTESPLVVAAGAKKVITVTLAANAKAVKTGNITITTNAEGIDAFSFNANAYVLKDCETVDFNTTIPTGWEASSSWTYANGIATIKTKNQYLVSKKLTFSADDFIIVKARATDSYGGDYLTIEGSADNGTTWTAFTKTISDSDDLPKANGDYATLVVSGIPATVNKLRFGGYYADFDEISGLTYAASDPKLAVYSDAEATLAVTSGTAKDFGWVNADATATYYIKNAGTGTLIISNISADEGFTAATEGNAMTVAADADPLALTITMSADAVGVKSGTVTVTTDGGTFTIPVSGFAYGDRSLIDFSAATQTAGWSMGSWTVAENVATVGYTSGTMQTTSFVVNANENLYVEAKRTSSNYSTGTLSYSYSTDNGENWTDGATLFSSTGESDYATYTISDIAGNEERTVLIRFNGAYAAINRIYGFEAIHVAEMVVSQTDPIAFGMQTEETTETSFTISNANGSKTLEGLSVTLGKTGEDAEYEVRMEKDDAAFTGTEIAVGEVVTVYVKQLFDINKLGAKSDVLTIAATDQTPVAINLSGATRDASKLYVDFDGSNEWPAAIASHGANWEVNAGYARQNSTTASSLILAPLTISNETEALRFKVSRNSNDRDLAVRYTTNGGVTWNDYNFGTDETPKTSLKDDITSTSSYNDFEIKNIPAGTVAFDFYGKAVKLDNINADYKTAAAPLMAFTKVTDNISGANLTADAEATYTLTNNGNADYVGTVATSNVHVLVGGTDVSYNGSGTLTIPAGKTAEITVTMPFAAPYGEKNANLSITSDSWVADIVADYTANLVDPDAINVDFASLPAGWYNGGWTVDGSAYIYSGVEKEFISEQFAAEAGKNVLSFKAKAQSGNEGTLKVYTSTDRKSWGEATEITLTGEYQDKSLETLADGNYYVKFVSMNANIDDLVGLKKIATVPKHDLYVSASNIPTETKVPVTEITATATVYSLRAAETGVYAKLFFGDAEVATAAAQDISLNGSANFTLTGDVPAAEGTYAAKVVVYYSNNNNAFETATTDVVVEHIRTLEIASFTRTDGNGTLDANSNNQISPAFSVTVTNTGTTEATPTVKIYQGETEVASATAAAAIATAQTSDAIALTATDMSASEGGALEFTAKVFWNNTDTEAKATSATPVTINVNAAAPKFELADANNTAMTDGDGVAFGMVREATAKTFTIKNTGNKALELVSIVAPEGYEATAVTDANKTITAGESLDINVTLKAEQGKKSGDLVFTYKVDATNNATFTLALSGRSISADTWVEDFATGIPATWENKGWTVEEGVAYSGGYETVQTLMTPRLAATNGEELTYDATFKYTGYTLKVEYSTDKTNWTEYATISDATVVEQSFVAPAEGNYYLRFTGTRYAQLDNFVGFTLNIPEHDTEIAAASIPTTGTQYGTYTATVTLKENAGKAEEVTAILYVDGDKQAVKTETITANGSTVVTVTWKPETVTTDAVEAYLKVTADGIDLATDKVNLTIAAPFTLSDIEAPTFAEATTTYEALVLNREFVEGWNTVCLPFAITDIEEFFGDGAKAYTLNSYVAAENTLKFESATTMNASYPYVVYVPAAIASGKVVENVEIGSQYNTPSTTATYFVGTYAPIDDMSGKWGIGTAKDGKAKIMKGITGAKMKGFRAYFALPGNTQGAPTMMFDEEVITGISAIEMAAEEGERIYNLNGQRVMNPKKGQMYIVNGKKVAIK